MRGRWVVLTATLLVAPIPRAVSAGNGDPVDCHPNYRERALLALTNACRQGPQAYRDTYLHDPRILTPKAYPAVPPLYWTLPLNRSARAHSIDMATTPCFQHDSCDGTDAFDRIRSYYKDAAALGENIASGYESPLETVNQQLVDGGAADHSRGDGHRKNLLSAKFRETGSGCAFGGPNRTYDTQDFGGGAPDFTTPLVSGSHVLGGGKITFLASFDAHGAGAPRAAGACREYRFRFRDAAGRTWWHPEGGVLYTTGEGGCEREYQPSGARTP